MPLFLVQPGKIRQNSAKFPSNILINRLAWRLAWEISECSIKGSEGIERETLTKEDEEEYLSKELRE